MLGSTPCADEVIDATLQQLNPQDRETILLRYFENLTFAEIAARQNLKEDTVRMRLNRALARLRGYLSQQGVRSTEAALATLLASEAAASSPVPAALAGAVAQAGFASGQAAGTSLGLISLMSAKKSLILTAVIAGLVGALSTAYPLYRRMAATAASNHQLQVDNDLLRDRLTAALLAGPASGLALAAGQSKPATTGAQRRLDQINSAVKLREATRDAVAATNKIRRHPGPNNEDVFVDAPQPTYVDPENFKLANGWQFHLTAEGWKWNFPAQAVPAFVNGVPQSPPS